MEWTFPFAYALDLRQPQILLVALVILSAERALAGRQACAGALLALAAAIKLAPALLVLAFLACGMCRAAGAFAAAAAALFAASLALAGPDAHVAFLDAVRALDGVVLLSVANPSLETILVLLREAARGTDIFALGANTVVEAPRFLSLAVPVAAAAGCIASVAVMRGAPGPARLFPGMVLLYQVAAFAGGFAWLHYLMLPLVALLWVPAIWPARRCLAAAVLVLFPLSTPVFTRLIDLQASNTVTIALGAAAFVALWAVFAAAVLSPRPVERAGSAGTRSAAAIVVDG